MKNLFLLCIALVSLTVSGQTLNKNAKHVFAVDGVCDQCKKRIEKAAYKVPGVKMADWDMETHQLTILLNETKSSLDDVQLAVAKIGHDNQGKRATDADYQALHHCCQYERKPER